MITDYTDFLNTKRIAAAPSGFDVATADLNPALFDWQAAIVRWALKRGRAALFEDCGLGKSLQQLVWAEQVHKHTGLPVLILAPLAVAEQTAREGAKFGIAVKVVATQDEIVNGLNVTNYQKMRHFDPSQFGGIVLDESSILKSYDGKFRSLIIDWFKQTPYRLACTATPAPNDFMELGNHAEFLGVMSRTEMLSTFFVHDGGDTSAWRLKGHAETEFWQWVASWAVMIRRPSDLGFSDEGFTLPPIHREQVTVTVDHQEDAAEGAQLYLVMVEAKTLTERRNARKVSLQDRIEACADLVNASHEPWVIWCNLNAESEGLTAAIPGAVEVTGSDSDDHKAKAMLDFAEGRIRVLVTKPSICGFGMNWQHCCKMAFVGLSDSYEQTYQAERRCWRFGQQQPVTVYVITSELDGAVVRNISRKQADADAMAEGMINHMSYITREQISSTQRETITYATNVAHGDTWTAYKGDCVEMVAQQPDASIDYEIFSPPFASLYTYSNSDRDMGNSRNYDEFMEHYRYLAREQFRTLKPGRLLSFHCMLLPTSKQHHGYIGLQDFRGDLIRLYQSEGFIFHSEVVIWKDPVTAMQRTKALGLLYKQVKKDSCMSRQGVPDYLVTMRKPGVNPDPVTKTPDQFPVELWQRYASPVWMDINPSDTLQYTSAREHNDERHICPLQLEVIERGIDLWSNPGDVVRSPFMGIGSEGAVALKMGRRFVGVELKDSYYKQAVRNLQNAEQAQGAATLFDLMPDEVAA